MEELNGIQIKKFPFQNLERIGLVLFHEFPATRIYKTPENKSIIIDWIDCSRDGLDRFIAYESLDIDLISYLEGKLSHYNLIKLAVSNLIVAFDGAVSQIIDPRIVTFSDLVGKYLPDQDVFLDKSDIVEYKQIAEYIGQLKKHTYPVHEYALVSLAERSVEYTRGQNEEFSLNVKFDAIDIVAGNYSFSEGGQKFTGQFDPLIHTTDLVTLNFVDSYKVKIKRIIQHTTTGQSPIFTDLIVSLIKKP